MGKNGEIGSSINPIFKAIQKRLLIQSFRKVEDHTKQIIREYIFRSLEIEGLAKPQNESLEKYNKWKLANDFECKTGVLVNDSQLKRCKTVGSFVSICYSAVILSPNVKIENLQKIISELDDAKPRKTVQSMNDENLNMSYSGGNGLHSTKQSFESFSIEGLFQMVRQPLEIAKADIIRLKTGESKFDAVRFSFLDSLTKAINEAEEQEDYLKKNLVQDHLVIAFFGETNAGKSTIIDTFRIIFDEETRRKALEKARKSNVIGVDGTIVGDGRSDYTKNYDEYNMTIDGKDFTLIDVPGIEGNEAEYKEGIKKALQKAHCVFYVHGSDKKPNTKTTEKIKEYLNDWVGVYSIRNIRGGSEQYDEDEERDKLLTDSVLRASQLSESVFAKTLGDHYKGNIDVQGLLALCAKAIFSPTRTELIGTQSDLIEYFGNSDAIFSFSHFQDLIDEVRKISKEYKGLINQSNRDKVKALARRAIDDVNKCIFQEKEAIGELDKKLKTFEKNVLSVCTKAERRLNIRIMLEKEFDVMRYALYQAIDTGNEDTVKSVAKRQSQEIEDKLVPQIKMLCFNTTQWYSDELNRLKRDLDSSISIGNINITINNISVGIDASGITSEMQDFDFGNAITTAMQAAGIAMIIPGVGWVLGGVIALFGAIFGGIFGNDGRSEAKQKVDSTINEVCEKTIMQLNNGALKKFKDQYKFIEKEIRQKVKVERNNIQNLKSDIENLKENMTSTINLI